MPLIAKGTTIKKLDANAVTCKKGIANGVTVFTSEVQALTENSWTFILLDGTYATGTISNGVMKFTTAEILVGPVYYTEVDFDHVNTVTMNISEFTTNGNTVMVLGVSDTADELYSWTDNTDYGWLVKKYCKTTGEFSIDTTDITGKKYLRVALGHSTGGDATIEIDSIILS